MSSAANRAYHLIKGKILDGTLEPGSQLREEELAKLCDVSRTPIRDAISRLTSERFVYRSDSQRSFVTKWSEDDIFEIYSLRTMLEGQAAERAASRITAEGIKTLKESCTSLELAISNPEPDIDGFVEQNRVFHETVISAANSHWLASTIGQLTLLPVVHSTVRNYSSEQLRESLIEHVAITRAIESGDPEWAKAQMTVHIRRSLQTKWQAASVIAPEEQERR